MRHEIGTFRVDVQIENPARPGEKRTVNAVLVDTGAELSWVPAPVLESLGVERNNRWRFRQADGSILERWTGTVVIGVGGRRVDGATGVSESCRRRIVSADGRSRLTLVGESLRP